MPNRDYSHVTRVQHKAAQTLFAAKVVTAVAQANNSSYMTKGGSLDASIGVATLQGQAAAGETVAPFIQNPIAQADIAGTNTSYNITTAIAAFQR
ncbi:MAG: hypothetical protein EBU66_06060 [Bacteroidetes bacterium]|nr:hypothetical protein [Bacteroidota bacterium]